MGRCKLTTHYFYYNGINKDGTSSIFGPFLFQHVSLGMHLYRMHVRNVLVSTPCVRSPSAVTSYLCKLTQPQLQWLATRYNLGYCSPVCNERPNAPTRTCQVMRSWCVLLQRRRLLTSDTNESEFGDHHQVCRPTLGHEKRIAKPITHTESTPPAPPPAQSQLEIRVALLQGCPSSSATPT